MHADDADVPVGPGQCVAVHVDDEGRVPRAQLPPDDDGEDQIQGHGREGEDEDADGQDGGCARAMDDGDGDRHHHRRRPCGKGRQKSRRCGRRRDAFESASGRNQDRR